MSVTITKRDRVFLVDHMCVLPFGHNLNALVLFERELKKYFAKSVCLACKDLPDYAEQASLVSRELVYPYSGIMERAPKRIGDGHSGSKSSFPKLGNLKRQMRKVFFTAVNELFGIDIVLNRTKLDWQQLFKRHNISQSDAIFFPSSDFYGCTALLEFLKTIRIEDCPSVHMRLIGVAENANYAMSPARPVFVNAIRNAKARGLQLSVSAETPRYVRHISSILDDEVHFMPYPLSSDYLPVPWRRTKVVASPGQGRADKGFFRLSSIFSEVERKRSNLHFAYDVQNMRRTDRDHRPKFESSLERIPNLLLRPARLKQEDIDNVYKRSDIMLLPYDVDTYALRGSAVYQETLSVGRPVVCSKDIGFDELVERYGNGKVAATDAEFADAIIQLASMEKKEIEQMMLKSRASFEQDIQSSFAKIAEALGA